MKIVIFDQESVRWFDTDATTVSRQDGTTEKFFLQSSGCRPCHQPPEIARALTLVEAVREMRRVDPNWYNPETCVTIAGQGFGHAVNAVCQPIPPAPPAPSDAEEIATRLIYRTDALVREVGGTLRSRQMTAALRAIAEEIAAAKEGK